MYKNICPSHNQPLKITCSPQQCGHDGCTHRASREREGEGLGGTEGKEGRRKKGTRSRNKHTRKFDEEKIIKPD